MQKITVKLVRKAIDVFKDGFVDCDGPTEEIVVRQVVAKVLEVSRQVKCPGSGDAAVDVPRVEGDQVDVVKDEAAEGPVRFLPKYKNRTIVYKFSLQ